LEEHDPDGIASAMSNGVPHGIRLQDGDAERAATAPSNLKKRRLSLSSEIIAGGYLHPQDKSVVARGLATGLAVRATSCRSEMGAAARLQQRPVEHSGFCSPESGNSAKNAIKKPDGRTIRLKTLRNTKGREGLPQRDPAVACGNSINAWPSSPPH
jgi:hypothetical protein